MQQLGPQSCKHLQICPAPLNPAGLFLYPKLLVLSVFRELRFSTKQGMGEDCRKCLDLHSDTSSKDYIPSFTFQIPSTKVL